MSGNKTSFVEQLKQNSLFFSMIGIFLINVTEQIEEFTGISSRVVGIFALLITMIPVVWWVSSWLKKRKKYVK